jgi:hypothetical protein
MQNQSMTANVLRLCEARKAECKFKQGSRTFNQTRVFVDIKKPRCAKPLLAVSIIVSSRQVQHSLKDSSRYFVSLENINLSDKTGRRNIIRKQSQFVEGKQNRLVVLGG